MSTNAATPAERIQRAKEELATGAVDYAQASAIIAIAELLQMNIADAYAAGVQAGSDVTAGVINTVMKIVSPGINQADGE